MIRKNKNGDDRIEVLGEAWTGDCAWLKYRASILAGPPANGDSSSCWMIFWEILSTSLKSDKSDACTKRHSEP
jgi:hypothetical protein